MGICGLRRMKCLLSVFNIILFFSGGGLLGLGIVLKTGAREWLKIEDLETILNHDKDLLKHSSHLLLAAGSILIFVVLFIGCYGICKECQWFLTMYFVVLFIAFCLQVTASILASRALEVAKAENNTISGFKQAYGDGKYAEGLTRAWRLAEASLECCGYNNGDDYNYARNVSIYYYSGDKKDDGFPDFPESCCVGAWRNKLSSMVEASDPEYVAENPAKCRDSWDNNMTRVEDTDFYHGMGCKQKLYKHIYWISGGAIGVAFLELLCMILVIRVCRKIEHY